jgi:lactoylglutathione lyase
MRIEHIALWTRDLERLRAFYERHFGARSSDRYENPAKQFSSYFLRFDSGARLELMHGAKVLAEGPGDPPTVGLAHFAIAVGDEAAVDALVGRMRAAGQPVIDGPRRTGDGYYEAVVLDPDGNRIEITAQRGRML